MPCPGQTTELTFKCCSHKKRRTKQSRISISIVSHYRTWNTRKWAKSPETDSQFFHDIIGDERDTFGNHFGHFSEQGTDACNQLPRIPECGAGAIHIEGRMERHKVQSFWWSHIWFSKGHWKRSIRKIAFTLRSQVLVFASFVSVALIENANSWAPPEIIEKSWLLNPLFICAPNFPNEEKERE